ncbi:MAG: hypothetical protein WC455_03155 [Dehalococcoidia bacterium]
MFPDKINGWKPYLIPLLIVGIVFGIYFLSNSTPLDWYKHYVYQAQAFLDGRADLQGFPGYYQDLVNYNGKSFLASPPVPALVLLPAVAIWGTGTDEVRISMLIGAINVALVWILLGRMSVNGWKRPLLTILFGFGTVHWQVAITGTTWFFAEIVAVFFLLLCLIEYFGRKRAALIGLLLGFAALSRLPVVVGGIFFLAMLYKDGGIRRPLKFIIGLAVPLAFYAYFNYARFGNPFQTGYALHSYAYYFAADIEQYGMFNLNYIPKHLYTILLMPPEYISYFPFLKPKPEGMSILLTTPAILYIVKAKFSESANRWLLLSIIGILLPTILWFSTGWVQFGYRYSLDFIPFILILIVAGMGKTINKKMIALIVMSVAVNLWGTLWSVHLGW